MKYLRRFLLYPLLLLVFIALALVAYFAGTDHGLQTALKLARDKLPGQLQWQQAEGRLLGPLSLRNLVFAQPDGIQLALEEAHLRWDPAALLGGKLHLQQLQLDGLSLHLPPAADTPEEKHKEPLALPNIDLPIDLALDDIDLTDIRIYPDGAKDPVYIERVLLKGAGENDQFRLVDLSVTAPQGQATLKGYVEPKGDYPLDLTLLWTFRHAEFGDYQGDGSVQGSLAALEINHQLTGPVAANVSGTISNALNEPHWDTRIQASSKNLRQFSAALDQAPLQAELASKGHLKGFTASGTVKTELSQTGPLELTLDSQGDLHVLHLKQLLLALKANGGQLALSGNLDLENLAADLSGSWQQLAWPLITETPAYQSPEGQFTFKGKADDFEATLETRLDGQLLQPLNAVLNARSKNQVITLQELQISGRESDTRLRASGDIDLHNKKFDLSGNWLHLAWPMQGPSQLASPEGKFETKGRFDDYRFSANTLLEGTDIPSGRWDLTGKGHAAGLDDFALQGKTLGGSVSVKGETQWQPAVRWKVDVFSQQINPGEHWPQAPGSIDLQLTSIGQITDKGPDLVAVIKQLSGEFKGKPVNGTGEVRIQGQTVNVDRLLLESLGTRLTANGSLDQRWNLDFDLDVPSLEPWSNGLGGQLSARGKFSGTKEQPAASITLSADKLQSGGNIIGTLKGDIDIDLAGQRASDITIQGDTLMLGGQPWKSLSVTGNGRPQKHALEVQLSGQQGDISTRLSGGLREGSWQGTLEKLDALKTEFGDWNLQQATSIRANAEEASTESLCLVSLPTLLCLQGQWKAGSGSQGEVTLTDLEPKRFKAFLPEDLVLSNRVNLQADGKVGADGVAHAKASLSISPGTLTLRSGSEPAEIKFGASQIDARLQGQKAQARVTLDLGSLGGLNAQLGLDGLSENGRLSGALSPDFRDLSMVSIIAPQLQEVRGRFGGQLQLAGTVMSPQLMGHLDLENFGAEIPQVAMVLENTELHVRGDGNSPLQITGLAHSGGGQLALDGQLDPQSRAFNLTIKGEEFVAADSSQLQAVISPDLEVSMDKDGMSVSGKIAIPRAFIDANGGDSSIKTVAGSADVVIVDTEGQRQSNKAASNLNLNVQVELGDDIKVEAGEFSGQLKGHLQVEQTPQLAPRGTGTIEVVGGDYVIYGQQLNIQRGRILFSGGPVDNPQLDMDVARRVEAYDVLAGARIRGSAQSPLLQLYSEPSMPDASILSYILLGQPPGTKGGSYTLGKFLTPDLYVSYGIGLFNAINTFNMRYRLTEKLSLQAASGLANSADLIYSIER